MKVLLCCLALAWCWALAAQEPERYGKSDGQILAMGFDRWVDFYSTKAGSSTMAMVQAAVTYGDAARERTDKLLAKKSPTVKAQVKSLRKAFEEFTDGIFTIGIANSGGGTIWNIFGASSYPMAEEALYGALGGKLPKPKPRKTSELDAELRALRSTIDAAMDANYLERYDKKEALRQLGRVRTAYAAIVKEAAKFDRRGSDFILGYCYDRIRIVSRWD